MRLGLVLLGALSVFAGAACGGDDDDDTVPGQDAGQDAGDDAATDAGEDAGLVPATFTGRVLGEEVEGVAPPIEGATLSLLDAEGAVLVTGDSDVDGGFALDAAEAAVAFLLVEPVEDYVGQLRAQQSREGLAFYDVYLQLEAGVVQSYGYAGLVYDSDKGIVAVGFNPVDPLLGGEGVRLRPGPDHDPAFVLVEDDAITSDVLPPVCPNEGPVPCTDAARSNNVFIPNVTPGTVRLELVQPAAGTCAVRFPIDDWLVQAHVTTVIDVDCQP